MTIADIVLETRALCDATSTSYTDATLLRRLNAGYEETVGKILGQDGSWQFDDSNFTTFPTGTTTLVAAQHDYTFDVSHLMILAVEVKDKNGIWVPLSPIDESEMGVPATEFCKTDGLPCYYDKKGSSVLVYPAPTAATTTLTAGLKVHFQRTASIFTSAEVTTGTKLPGFPSPFHIVLCYKAAIPYCMSFKKDRVALYEKKAMDLEEALLEFLSRRARDERDVISTSGVAHR